MPMASGCRRGTEECAVPPLGTGIQAIQLSPYRTGVAGRSHTRLRAAPAFHPCSCPLLLSDSGKVVASQSFALNFGHLWWQCTRCAPRRTVSLHPAQASQRPCEGPVSSKTTCWLHDMRQTSMPLRGREHQCSKATVICHTFCIDSSLVLVPRHRREVCALARRVMFQPVSVPLQDGLRFFPPPYPHRHGSA